MGLDFLSLPPEILAKFFSNIPWNELINVKLTAKKFKFVTEKYHKDMKKPKLCEINFEDGFTTDEGNNRIKINYVILITDEDSLGDIDEFRKELLFASFRIRSTSQLTQES